MAVWLTIPSARPPEEVEPVLKMWRERGYKIALWLDQKHMGPPFRQCEFALSDRVYPGYAVAVNSLIRRIIEPLDENGDENADYDPSAEWFVCAGDDTFPDPNHSAEEIADQCNWYFTERHMARCESVPEDDPPSWIYLSRMLTGEQMQTFGVMQPTGDRWGEDRNTHAFEPLTPGCDSCNCRQCGQGPDAPRHMVGAYIDRVAGSPWIGREFARRMYGGNGPYWPEYTHMGVDEELQHVAIKMGVFWQRPDLTHYHNHWGRPQPGEKMGSADRMPTFLAEANSPQHWDKFKRLFATRKANGFPGHEPIA